MARVARGDVTPLGLAPIRGSFSSQAGAGGAGREETHLTLARATLLATASPCPHHLSCKRPISYHKVAPETGHPLPPGPAPSSFGHEFPAPGTGDQDMAGAQQ